MISTYAFKDLMILPQTLHFRGVCPQFGTFTINFIDESGINLLHLSFRIDQQTLVINENQTGDWGEEQEIDNLAFPRGRPFVIRLEFADENATRVFLDEDLLTEFTWRADIRKASRVDLTDVEFALFREGDTYKTVPEDVARSHPLQSDLLSSDHTFLNDVLLRLDEIVGVQKELLARIGDITNLVADVKKQHHDITAGMQTLLAGGAGAPDGGSSKPEKAA